MKSNKQKSRANLDNSPRDLSDKENEANQWYVSSFKHTAVHLYALVLACKLQIGLPNAKSPIRQEKIQSLLFIST
jgi:hypothetical protein